MSHFMGLQSAVQIVYHQQMHQSRLFLYLPFHKKQTNLQSSAIIRINVFESNKNFKLAGIIV